MTRKSKATSTRPASSRSAKKSARATASAGRPPKFKPAQVISALEASAGIISAAARILRCSNSTVAGYITRHPEISAALEEIQDERLDIAETALVKMMMNDTNPSVQLNASIFYLRTKGKRRGYSTATEVMGKDGGPIVTKEEPPIDVSNLSEDELASLDQLLAKASA